MSVPFAERDESVLNNDYFRERKQIEMGKAQGRAYTPGTISDISTISSPLDSLFGTRVNTPGSNSIASSQTDLSEHDLPRDITIPQEDREKIEVRLLGAADGGERRGGRERGSGPQQN